MTRFSYKKIILILIVFILILLFFIQISSRKGDDKQQTRIEDNILFIVHDEYINLALEDFIFEEISNNYTSLPDENLPLKFGSDELISVKVYGDGIDIFKYVPAINKPPVEWYAEIQSQKEIGGIHVGNTKLEVEKKLNLQPQLPDEFILVNLEGGLEFFFEFNSNGILTKIIFSNPDLH